MTNRDLLDIFKSKYPEVPVDDYRPVDEIFLPTDLPGIIVWTKDGDVIAFFLGKKNQLEPCPFCPDGKAVLKSYRLVDYEPERFYVECASCGATVGMYCNGMRCNCTAEQAIRLWNHRREVKE